MAKSSQRGRKALLVLIELLTVVVLILTIITLVGGRTPHSLQGYPILTFDTSSVRTNLTGQGIAPGNVQDWYEPNYLSVCKGMWQSASSHLKNGSSTVCTKMNGGYTFSLPNLLAADTGLPIDNPVLSSWSFAVLDTMMPFTCIAFAIAFASVTVVAYFITFFTAPNFTADSPLLVPRIGYLASIGVLNTVLISAIKITVMMHDVLANKIVSEDGVAWSSGLFYVLTWLMVGFMVIQFIWSMVLAFKVAAARSPLRQFERKHSGY